MEIVGIACLGIVASLLLLIVRKERPELALPLGLLSGLVLFFAILPHLSEVVMTLGSVATESGLESFYFGIIMKVLAISYVSDFGASICRDAGEDLMATRVEMAGKVLVVACALPVVREVLLVIKGLLAG